MSNTLYISIIFIILFSSCKEQTGTVAPITTSDSTSTEIVKDRKFLSVNAQNLRIRRTPDLEGEVAVTLPLNTIVEYLHDSTKFTTPITYNGKDYNSHWYKIRTANNIQGWIYGGLAHFLTETENRRIVTLEKSSDKEGNTSQGLSKKGVSVQKIDPAFVNRYKEILAKLEVSNIQSVTTAIKWFPNTFGSANGATRDAGFKEFQDFHSRVLQKIKQKHTFNKYNHLQNEIKIYGKANMNVDDFTKKLEENGFNFGLDKSSSTVYLKKDIDFVARHLYKEVSGAMREYIDQYQLEDETTWLGNDKLLISPEQLAQWLIFWDNFLIKHPKFILKSASFRNLTKQLDLLLIGSPKSPAFADNEVLHSDFKSAYLWILEKEENSRLGLLLKDYYAVLEQQEFKNSSITKQAQRQLNSALFPS
ncbi:MAG: SH3 domain-containing protein [Aureispira sp.]|nr:SH3 domain-containing protein [Aureispira sp.]